MNERRFGHRLRRLGRIGHCEKRLPAAIHGIALFVQNVVVFQEMLAHIEVRAFDLRLGLGHRLRHEAHLDRFVCGKIEALHKPLDAVAAEDAHEVVVERKIELR